MSAYEPDLDALADALIHQNVPQRRSNATLDVAPSPDIAAIETAAEQLVRDGHIRTALPLWAIALRLREEANRDS